MLYACKKTMSVTHAVHIMVCFIKAVCLQPLHWKNMSLCIGKCHWKKRLHWKHTCSDLKRHFQWLKRHFSDLKRHFQWLKRRFPMEVKLPIAFSNAREPDFTMSERWPVCKHRIYVSYTYVQQVHRIVSGIIPYWCRSVSCCMVP